jgi:O-antigen ligase
MSALLPSLIRASRFTGYLLTAEIVVTAADTTRRRRFLFGVFFANIAVQALLIFGQGMGIVPNYWPEYWLTGYGTRPVGTLSPHHLQAGIVMILGVAMAATLLRHTRSWIIRAILVSLMAVMVMDTVFAGVRTAWVGLLGFFLAFFFIHRFRALGLFLAMTIGAAAFTWAVSGWVGGSLEESFDERVTARLEAKGYEGLYGERTVIYREWTPQAIARAPWILLVGTGFQNIRHYLGATGAHNNYLHVLLELGVLGFVVYLAFLRNVLKSLRRAGSSGASAFEKTAALDAWAAFVAVLVTMFFGETLWAQYSTFTLSGQIMALVGICVAALRWGTDRA